MFAAQKLMQPEVREKMTISILDMLSHLPEAEKNMFIWKHYCGWPVEKIASALKCSVAEVDRTLRSTNALLSSQVGSVLA
ncbi:MAG: sigma-70 family RNA polymerase sigma factor [Acidimicrobiia bacterium]|nr:sigma-70 family RNA polymerase sigma factor [Acidimicrobiia bacterium]